MRRTVLWSVGVAVALLSAACSVAKTSTSPSSGSSASSGAVTTGATGGPATGTPLKFGAAVPLTGPAATSGRQLQSALEASAKYLNAHGGAAGHPIEWTIEDNAFPSGTQGSVAVHNLVDDGVMAVLNFGTPGVTATYSYLVSQKVPDLILFSGLASIEPLDPSAASIYTDYGTQGESLGKYVAAKYPGKTVAVLYQNDPLGQGYLTGFKKFDNNIKTAQPYVSSDTDFSSQLNAMKASGADLAACFCLSGQIAQVLNFRHSAGWDVPVITESSNAGAALVAAVGAGLTENVISNDFFPPTAGADATPAITALVKNMQSVDSSVSITSFTVVAAALNDVIVGTAAKAAAAGTTLTRDTLMTALHATSLSGAWYGQTSSLVASPARSIFSCWKPNVIHAGVPVPDGDVVCEKDLS
jgi:branched-chain amino acid transport system substrate-binding protein